MKMCINKRDIQKMASAYLYMQKVRNKATAQRYTSRLYEYHKKIRAKILSEQMTGEGNPMFGKTHKQETLDKISNTKLGVKTLTVEGRKAKSAFLKANNPMNNLESIAKIVEKKAKHFTIQDPFGTVYNGKNLAKFCREHNIGHGNLIMYKKAKGWMLL